MSAGVKVLKRKYPKMVIPKKEFFSKSAIYMKKCYIYIYSTFWKKFLFWNYHFGIYIRPAPRYCWHIFCSYLYTATVEYRCHYSVWPRMTKEGTTGVYKRCPRYRGCHLTTIGWLGGFVRHAQQLEHRGLWWPCRVCCWRILIHRCRRFLPLTGWSVVCIHRSIRRVHSLLRRTC